MIDPTGVVTEQFIAERKMSQLQAELQQQQQVQAGQIGLLMQQSQQPDLSNPKAPAPRSMTETSHVTADPEVLSAKEVNKHSTTQDQAKNEGMFWQPFSYMSIH